MPASTAEVTVVVGRLGSQESRFRLLVGPELVAVTEPAPMRTQLVFEPDPAAQGAWLATDVELPPASPFQAAQLVFALAHGAARAGLRPARVSGIASPESLGELRALGLAAPPGPRDPRAFQGELGPAAAAAGARHRLFLRPPTPPREGGPGYQVPGAPRALSLWEVGRLRAQQPARRGAAPRPPEAWALPRPARPHRAPRARP